VLAPDQQNQNPFKRFPIKLHLSVHCGRGC
jgi:hypothetical protein